MSGRFLSHIAPNNAPKFGGPALNHSREIRLQVIGDGIFYCFGQNAEWRFCPIAVCHDMSRPSSSIHAGYDAISYFRSEVIAKRLLKMLPPMAMGHIFPERFKRGLQNFSRLSGTISLTKQLDMTSPATSRRHLLNFEYYIAENTSADGFGSNFSRTAKVRIMKFYVLIGDSQPHKSVRYDVTACFRSAANCSWILRVSAQNWSSRHRGALFGHGLTQDHWMSVDVLKLSGQLRLTQYVIMLWPINPIAGSVWVMMGVLALLADGTVWFRETSDLSSLCPEPHMTVDHACPRFTKIMVPPF